VVLNSQFKLTHESSHLRKHHIYRSPPVDLTTFICTQRVDLNSFYADSSQKCKKDIHVISVFLRFWDLWVQKLLSPPPLPRRVPVVENHCSKIFKKSYLIGWYFFKDGRTIYSPTLPEAFFQDCTFTILIGSDSFHVKTR